MRRYLCILLLAACAIPAAAGAVEDIRAYYNEVKADLDGFYRTQVVINRDYLPYPALGNYQETIDFYWRSEAGFSRLVLAIWSSEWAAHTEYGEVLYEVGEVYEGDEEEVVFQFVSSDNYEEYGTEIRWYFSGGRLVQAAGRSSSPEGVVEFVPDPEEETVYGHDHEELLDMFYSIHY